MFLIMLIYFIYLDSLNPHNNLQGGYCYYSYFTDEETEAWKGKPLARGHTTRGSKAWT